MRSPFPLSGCALSVAVLLTATPAQSKRVSPSAHIASRNASVSADGQTDAPDDETPEERTARLKRRAAQNQKQQPDKKTLPERDPLPNEQPEDVPEDTTDSPDAPKSHTRRNSDADKSGKKKKMDTTVEANDVDEEDNTPLRNAPGALRKKAQPLELFGYSYFTQARETIQIRRNTLRQYAGNGQAGVAGMSGKRDSGKEISTSNSRGEEATQNRNSGERNGRELGQDRSGQEKSGRDGIGQDKTGQETDEQGKENASNRKHSNSIDARQSILGPDDMQALNVFAPAPERYQLGAGDTVTIRYWSRTLEATEATLTVDAGGTLALPSGDRIVARGQTASQAQEAIRAHLARKFRQIQVTLALKELRTITVLVTGEAYAPGSYQMPATVTLFNMLYACGGASERGTLRNIQVRRTDGTTRPFDFYHFLLRGDSSQDTPLQPGDVIFIPPSETRVSVTGEVFRPAIFELLKNEKLRDAVGFAGGVKPSGIAQRVSVQSVQPGSEHRLVDANLNLQDATNNPTLYDGDIVELLSIRSQIANLVSVEGAVDQPSRYALAPNMTAADLIDRARGLRDDVYMLRADLFRANPDNTQKLVSLDLTKVQKREPGANPVLQPRDRLVVYSASDVQFMGFRRVTVKGAIRKPGAYYRADNMRVGDLLLQAGGPQPDASLRQAFLQRRNDDGTYGPLVKVDVGKALAGDGAENIEVQDRDTLTLFTLKDAQFTPESSVEISGPVQREGKYTLAAGMKLSDLLQLSGGALPKAGERIEIAHAHAESGMKPLVVALDMRTKQCSDDPVLLPGDIVILKARGEYEDKPRIVRVYGAVDRPGPVILHTRSMRLSDVIKEAGGLTTDAYMPGSEFTRNSEMLETGTQKQYALLISHLMDGQNQAEYKREMAKADMERLKSVNSASKSDFPISIPGLTGGAGDGATTAAASSKTLDKLLSQDLVSTPRVLSAQDLEPKGNVFVNLTGAMQKPGGNDDLVMMDGDVITVPTKPSTIQVVGGVTQSRAVPFQQGATAEYYVTSAGGFAPDAARDHIIVIRLGGGLMPLNKVHALLPGDVIMVPTKVQAEQLSKRSNGVDSFFKSLTSSSLLFFGAKKLLGF